MGISGRTTWLRAHRAHLHHAIWAVTVVALSLTGLLTADADDAIPFIAPFVVSMGWGCAACLLGIVAADEKPAEADGQPPRKRPKPPVTGLRAPWRPPYVVGYVAALIAGVLLGLRLGSQDLDQALSWGLFYPLAMLLGWLSGICAALLLLAMGIIVMGVLGFGRVVLTGEPGERALAIGPFVATLGLLLLPLVLLGVVSYDSPRRRDIWPLLGFVRDDVDVTMPVLLLTSQVSTWMLVVGLAGGYVVHRWARARARSKVQP